MKNIILTLAILSVGCTAVSCSKIKEHEKNNAKKELQTIMDERENDEDYQEYRRAMKNIGYSDTELDKMDKDAQDLINNALDEYYK